VPFNAEDYVPRIGRTGRAGASGLAMTLVSRDDMRMVGDIEKLIKKKIEIEPFEFDDEAPRRDSFRDRTRREGDDERPARSAAPRASAPAPRSAPSDPFFDQPYVASGSEAEAAWEQKTPAAPRGLSLYIKPKKKVAALFGGQKVVDEVSSS
jgi:superfamily II DNA/RNA helicase